MANDQVEPEESVSDNMRHNAPLDSSKLSRYDAAALTVARMNPSLTPNAIGVKLQEVGLSKDHATIYQRLRKNQYFKAEFQAVRQNLEQQLVRELGPLALKNTKRHLKDKGLHARDQFAYNKLVLDKVMADRKDGQSDSPIKIGSVQQLQVVFQGTLAGDNTETHEQVVDMTHDSDK
jgi:hypothetical protein